MLPDSYCRRGATPLKNAPTGTPPAIAIPTEAPIRQYFRVISLQGTAIAKLTEPQAAWLLTILKDPYWSRRADHLWFLLMTSSTHPLIVFYSLRIPPYPSVGYHVIGESCGEETVLTGAVPSLDYPPGGSRLRRCKRDPLSPDHTKPSFLPEPGDDYIPSASLLRDLQKKANNF